MEGAFAAVGTYYGEVEVVRGDYFVGEFLDVFGSYLGEVFYDLIDGAHFAL